MQVYTKDVENSISKSSQTEYFSSCYSLIQDAQYNIQLMDIDKKTAFIKWLNTFSDEHFKNINLTSKKQYTITCKKYDDKKYFMKFARVHQKTVNKKMEDDFISTQITDYPNCKIFIDTENNIMIIEKNMNVAQSIVKLKDLIAKVISKDISSFGYSICIELVTKATDFWYYVNENCNNLRYIEFTLVYPNFLNGYETVKEFIRGFDNYNPEIVTTRIENKEGHLKLPKNKKFITDALGYASSGAGSWKVSAKGSQRLKSSESVPTMHQLPSDISNLTTKQLELIDNIFTSVLKISKENRGIGDENENDN